MEAVPDTEVEDDLYIYWSLTETNYGTGLSSQVSVSVVDATGEETDLGIASAYDPYFVWNVIHPGGNAPYRIKVAVNSAAPMVGADLQATDLSNEFNISAPSEMYTLYAGQVSPPTGTIDEIFDFSVVYRATNGSAPMSVNLHIDGSNPAMTAQGSNWVSGVTFLTSRSFAVGSYPFHFTAVIPGGLTVRFPANPAVDPILVVGESAAGWELAVTALTVVPSNPEPGEIISVRATLHNQCTDPSRFYENVPYTFRFLDPNSDQVAEYSSTTPRIDQTESVTITWPTTAPFSPTGAYRVEFFVYPELDSDFTNNAASRTVFVSDGTAADLWLISVDAAYVYMDEVNPIFPHQNENSFHGSRYELTFANNYYTRIERGSENKVIHISEYKPFDGNNAIVWCIGANGGTHPNATMHFGWRADAGYVGFDSGEVRVSAGETARYRVSSNSALYEFYDDAFILPMDDAENVEPWFEGGEASADNREVIYTFDVPTGASPGTYGFRLAGYMRGDHQYFVAWLEIVIDSPAPQLTGLDPSIFSADDVIMISGTGLGTSGIIHFGTLASTYWESWTTSQIVCEVPDGVQNAALMVETNGGMSNPLGYSVISSTGNPEVVQPIPDQPLAAMPEWSLIADLDLVFWDPNGDDLQYAATLGSPFLEANTDSLAAGKLYLRHYCGGDEPTPVEVHATDADDAVVTDEFILYLTNSSLPGGPGQPSMVQFQTYTPDLGQP